jgi:predicted lysophospholipase L1 biosynthesis ABC-type transport system permease subunit
MREKPEYEKDLASIRDIMERSAKFLSLSGLSGILAGLYALTGAAAAYYLVHYPVSPLRYRIYSVQEPAILIKLIAIGAAVLIASLVTGGVLSQRKARQAGQTLWSPSSQRLLINLAVPLVAGGCFVLIMLATGHFGLAAPACLIFYGLALIQASSNTVDEIRYLGYSEIVLGLISAAMPGYGLIFWAGGFGILHIVYGAIMYNKYES